MKNVVSTVGVAGAAVGVIAGVGAATLLIEDPAPVIVEQSPTQSGDQPDEPDHVARWLEQHLD